MYYVYVLYSKKEEKMYIGYTNDLKRRLREHKMGCVYTTARYSGVELMFYEGFLSREDALRRERYFKTTKGKKSLRLMIRKSLMCVKTSDT